MDKTDSSAPDPGRHRQSLTELLTNDRQPQMAARETRGFFPKRMRLLAALSVTMCLLALGGWWYTNGMPFSRILETSIGESPIAGTNAQGSPLDADSSVRTPVDSLTLLRQRLERVEAAIGELEGRVQDWDARVRAPSGALGLAPDEGGGMALDGGGTQPYEAPLEGDSLQGDAPPAFDARRLEALQSFVTQLAGRLDREQNERRAVLAFLGMRLKASSGQPFVREAQALKNVLADADSLREPMARLAQRAKTPTPTSSDLVTRWEDVRPAVLEAIRHHAASTWKDHARGFFESLVIVRREGQPEATGYPALDALDQDVRTHAWKRVSEDVKALPESAQSVLKEWLETVNRRREIDRDIRLVGDSLSAGTGISEDSSPESPLPVPVPSGKEQRS